MVLGILWSIIFLYTFYKQERLYKKVVTFIVSLEYLQPKPPFKLGNQYSVHNAQLR